MIETERLILRPFETAADRADLAEVNAHPDVGAWLGGVRTPAETDAMVERIGAEIDRHGFGFWAAELKAERRVVGLIGLMRFDDRMPWPGQVEVGWRLHPRVQGQGLATEGAAACRDWTFANLDTEELVAITAVGNVRSQNVMRKIGMTRDPARDFEHPNLAADHPLRSHVLFAVGRK